VLPTANIGGGRLTTLAGLPGVLTSVWTGVVVGITLRGEGEGGRTAGSLAAKVFIGVVVFCCGLCTICVFLTVGEGLSSGNSARFNRRLTSYNALTSHTGLIGVTGVPGCFGV